MERTTDQGDWVSNDGGVTWLLVNPSSAFTAQQAADPGSAPLPLPEVLAAQAIHDEISSRMDEALTIGELKLAITEGLDAAIIQLQGGQA